MVKKKKVFQDQYWKVKHGYRKKMVAEKKDEKASNLKSIPFIWSFLARKSYI